MSEERETKVSVSKGDFTEVTVSSGEASDQRPANTGGLQKFMEQGNVITVEGSNVNVEPSHTTHGPNEAYDSVMEPDSILSTARMKNSSQVINDHKEMMEHKSDVVVKVKGIEMSLDSAIKGGFIGVSGSGELFERSVDAVMAPEPQTHQQMEDNMPQAPFDRNGVEIYRHLSEALGSEDRAYQAVSTMLAAWMDEREEDADARMDKAAVKLNQYRPQLGQEGSKKVAVALLESLVNGIGKGVSSIDPNIDAESFTSWLDSVREDKVTSLLLHCLSGHRGAFRRLVEAYKLNNRS